MDYMVELYLEKYFYRQLHPTIFNADRHLRPSIAEFSDVCGAVHGSRNHEHVESVAGVLW